MIMFLAAIFSLWIYTIRMASAQPSATEVENRLTKMNYNKFVLPPSSDGPLPLKMGFHVNNMAFDYQKGTWDVNIYLRMAWQDARLANFFLGYNVTESYRLRLFKEHIPLLWLPDIFTKNSDKVEKVETLVPEVLITLSPQGGIWYVPRLVKTLYCPDLQNGNRFVTCKIQFESYGHSIKEMSLQWLDPAVDIDSSVTLQGHQLHKYDVGTCNDTLQTGVYPCLEARFTWRRLPPRRVFEVGIYVTSILLLLVSWLGFWTPPGDRRIFIGLGVAVVLGLLFLAVTEYQNFAYLEIVSSAHTWLVFCLVMDLCMILEYAFAHVLIRIIPETFRAICCKCRIPEFRYAFNWIRNGFGEGCENFSHKPFEQFDEMTEPDVEENQEKTGDTSRPKGALRVGYMIDLISAVFIFPIALIGFFVIFSGVFLAFQ